MEYLVRMYNRTNGYYSKKATTVNRQVSPVFDLIGVEDGHGTPMGVSPLDPESSASTSSATPTSDIKIDLITLQRSGFYQ